MTILFIILKIIVSIGIGWGIFKIYFHIKNKLNYSNLKELIINEWKPKDRICFFKYTTTKNMFLAEWKYYISYEKNILYMKCPVTSEYIEMNINNFNRNYFKIINSDLALRDFNKINFSEYELYQIKQNI